MLVNRGGIPPDMRGMSDWRPLARGGFATVWQARQETLDRLVAVKVDERTLDSEVEQRRFLGEAKAAGNLSGHPGIVTVHDGGILADGRPYLVMKLCSGGSLTQWLRAENRQSIERIRSVGVRIADALAVAHEQGMLHRDVKPANILIDGYGNVALADFGLSAVWESGSAALTPAYAPPEVIRGDAPSESCDVYQLAGTLYALLSGRPPREITGNPTSLDEVKKHLDEPVKPLPEVNEDLMRVVLDGLSPAPSDRPTASEFRDLLTAIDLTDGAQAAPSAIATGAKHKRRFALVLVTATVLSLLLLVLGSVGVYLYEIDRSVTANISRGIDMPPEGSGASKRPQKAPEADKTIDYVLIGTDDGAAAAGLGRSDSIMVVHLNQARDQAYIISIPPDTWVTIPGHGRNRMNAAYDLGGPQLIVRTVETLTGARMDHIAMIDFRGFAALTKDLGGVTVRNRKAFSSNGYTFNTGDINLSGEAAMWYVRGAGSGLSQLDRAENQRNVLKAILAKGLSVDVVADPLRFTQFVGNAAKRVRVDNTLSDTDLRTTAVSLRVRPGAIRLLALPLGSERKIANQPVHPVDPSRLAELSQALRTDTMANYVQKYPRN
jgi:LCP family protein required for cell wall assembly